MDNLPIIGDSTLRQITPETLKNIFKQYNPSPLLYLLRFKGVDNSGNTVERFYVQNWEAVTSNGQLYQAAAFTIRLAADSADGMPRVTLTADSGDKELVRNLREFNRKPHFYLSVVVGDRPDDVEFAETEFEVDSWTVQGSTVQISLNTEPVLNEPISGDIITPTLYPLLWENVTINNVG